MRYLLHRDMFWFFILILQSSIFQVKTDICELTSNDGMQLISSQYYQSRQICSPTEFSTTNTHRIHITGQIVDYTTDCQKSINNANIEIIHLRQNIHSTCQELHRSNAHGYFNLTTTLTIPLTEKILIRITAPNYNTIVKEIALSSSSQERSKDLVADLQIALTVDNQQIQSEKQQRMNSMINDLLSNMTLEEKLGQLNFAQVRLNGSGQIINQNVSDKIRHGIIGGVFNAYTPDAVRMLQVLAMNNTRLKIPLIFADDVIHGHKTIFPINLGMSASWDLALIEQSARIAAQEASANGLN